VGAISNLVIVRGFTLDQIFAEISKCDVRCVSCHRIRTAKQFGWWSDVSDTLE